MTRDGVAPTRQPVLRRRRAEPRRDLGARPAQPVPLHDRPGRPAGDHRRRRRGHDRGGQRRRCAARTTAGRRARARARRPGMTNPIYSYPHGGHDASITGGFVYRGTPVPGRVPRRLLLRRLRRELDQAARARRERRTSRAVRNFEPPDGRLDGPYGDIVALAEGPDGSLWYVDTGPFENDNAGAIRRIRNIKRQPAADRASPPARRRAGRRRWPSASRAPGRPTPRAGRSPTAGTSATARPRRRPTRRTRTRQRALHRPADDVRRGAGDRVRAADDHRRLAARAAHPHARPTARRSAPAT